MPTISGPARVQSGSTACVTITGVTGSLDVKATLNGTGLKVKSTTVDGITTVCVMLPAGEVGVLSFVATDGNLRSKTKTMLVI